jgi:hypothetical protein
VALFLALGLATCCVRPLAVILLYGARTFLSPLARAAISPVLRRTSGTKCRSGSVAHFPKDKAAVSKNPGPKPLIF